MAGTLPKPRVSKNKQNTQLSYELSHRIYTAKSYPIRSSNGSTVIIYGHENGVRIVWRGGRSFKPAEHSSTATKKANGSDNAVISLDSDEEGPSAPHFEDKPEFEEEEEVDSCVPYPNILQCLDLFFGTNVLHLALLPSSILKAEGSSWRGLEPLRHKIVFAASCADNTVRLVTIPLTPPSPLSKSRAEFRSSFTAAHAGNGKWGETVVILSGHQKPSDGVSITIEIPIQGTVKGESRSSSATGPHFIIASHSREVTGLLLLFRVSMSSPNQHIEAFQKILLESPAKSISFNPALTNPPASQLLVADSTGACRIYDYKLVANTALFDEPSSDLVAERGTWLLSLYPGFQKEFEFSPVYFTGAHAGFGRKTIVDAKWVSNGRAILVLLQDGEWGIWDIEGVGPGASQGLLGRQGIKGGSLSQFSLRGFIGGAAARSAGPPQSTSSKFAPMTPGTRKSVDLFGSRGTLGPTRGEISVVEVPSSSPTKPADESILLWLGEVFTVIPSLSKYWSANLRKNSSGPGNLFNATLGVGMIKLENIDLRGEQCSGIEQIAKAAALSSTATSLPCDVVILGEHRLVILFAGNKPVVTRSDSRLSLLEADTNGRELDVVGIDRALARMEDRESSGVLGKRMFLQ